MRIRLERSMPITTIPGGIEEGRMIGIENHWKGVEIMSWLVVFISFVSPVVFLFVLLAVEWLQAEARPKHSLLRIGKHEQSTMGRS